MPISPSTPVLSGRCRIKLAIKRFKEIAQYGDAVGRGLALRR